MFDKDYSQVNNLQNALNVFGYLSKKFSAVLFLAHRPPQEGLGECTDVIFSLFNSSKLRAFKA
jgi:hypothetical protein